MADVSFGLVAPPQMNIDYANKLAFHQIQGLFALITSSDPSEQSETNLLPPQNLKCLDYIRKVIVETHNC